MGILGKPIGCTGNGTTSQDFYPKIFINLLNCLLNRYRRRGSVAHARITADVSILLVVDTRHI